MALRASLGASRGRLVRQLFTEHLLLSLIGGGLGILAGTWMIQGLVRFLPDTLPQVARVRLDGTSVAAACVLTMVAALFAGLIPAWRATAVALRGALRGGGHGTTSGAPHDRLRRGVVVAELALTVVLLVSAGLLLRSARALGQVAPGFSPDSVITARYALPTTGYPEADAVMAGHARMLAGARSALGERVALSSKVPLDGSLGGGSDFFAYGAGGARTETNAGLRLVPPGYLGTLGLSLRRGRDFTDGDDARGPRVVIISEQLSRRLGLGDDPIGRRIAGTSSPFLDGGGTPYPWEVVGVVRDPRDWGLRNDPQPPVFIPLMQTPGEIWEWSGREMHVVARATQPTGAMRSVLAAAVSRVDPSVALYDLQTMRQRLEASTALEPTNTVLLGALGVVALLLAITGLYEVVSYGVQQRRTEFGVRLALGAVPRDLVTLVVRWTLLLAIAGLGIGIPLALLAARALQGLLFGVGRADSVTFLWTAVLVVAVAALSALIPARSAGRVAPNSVLRN